VPRIAFRSAGLGPAGFVADFTLPVFAPRAAGLPKAHPSGAGTRTRLELSYVSGRGEFRWPLALLAFTRVSPAELFS